MMGTFGIQLPTIPLSFQLSVRLPALTCPLVTALLCFCTTFPTSTLGTKTVTVAEGIATAKADQATAVPGIEALPTWPYTDEFKAILGGVLGFWGGVGTMGTLFLVILLAQKYCCRSREDKDDSG